MSNVLITGENGSGKEVRRHGHPRIEQAREGPVQQGELRAIPTELIESELFGHKRGAFTHGAVNDKQGLMELRTTDAADRRNWRPDANLAGKAAPRASGSRVFEPVGARRY